MRDIVVRGCAQWGLSPSNEALDRLEGFMNALLERNRVMNLTAVTEPEEVARRHFLDCLFLLTVADFSGRRILDVGSGAGFPAVPLLCFEPGLHMTALDATGKRIAFIDESCKALGLDITAMAGRAEELGNSRDFREQYDLVVSRAVAPLPLLAELCLPFLKVGGLFLPQKSVGDEADDEVSASLGALRQLGGALTRQVPYAVPGLESRSQILVIEKVAPTPPAFPRRWAKIKEKPLA